MNSKNKEVRMFCVEMKRYDRPEAIWNFFWFRAADLCDEQQKLYAHELPFGDEGEYEDLKYYAETDRVQTREEGAVVARELLERYYEPKTLAQLDEDFARWVIHNQAPIEWQRGLDAGEPEVTDRVKVWVSQR